jgi:hypothetical protein
VVRQGAVMNHAELLERLEHAKLFFQAAVSGMKLERMESELIGPQWTVRDLAVHLLGWEEEFFKEAQAVARRNQHTFDYRIDPADDWSAWNREQIEKRRQIPTGEIFLALEKTQLALLEWLRGLNPSRLAHEADFPWGGHGTLVELLLMMASHKVSHAQKLREWRSREPRPTSLSQDPCEGP